MLKPSLKVLTVLSLSAIILSACGNEVSNSDSQDSTESKPATTKSNTSTSTSSHADTKVTSDEETFQLIGTFESNNSDSVSFSEDGTYKLSTTDLKTSGSFRVAAEYGQVLLLKMTNYNDKTPNLDSYVYVTFNIDHSINLENLGTFKNVNDSNKIASALYLANYLTEEPETSGDKIVGTWSNKNQDDHVITTTNFNPDGTFERYSDASGLVTRGTFALTNNDTEVSITTTVEKQEPATTTYSVNSTFTELTTQEPGISFTYQKNILPTSH